MNMARAQRCFEVVLSVVGLVLLSPVLLVAAALVKLTSKGPVLHVAERVGRDGRLFHLYKFRSMVTGALTQGAGVTHHCDSRVTAVGRWLRRSKIDELPQLVNILKGDMALVGPRPEDPRYVAHYTSEQKEILRVRPGITSPAAVQFRNEEALLSELDSEQLYLHSIMPQKLRLDLEYLARRSFTSDLRILWRTVMALFPMKSGLRRCAGEVRNAETVIPRIGRAKPGRKP